MTIFLPVLLQRTILCFRIRILLFLTNCFLTSLALTNLILRVLQPQGLFLMMILPVFLHTFNCLLSLVSLLTKTLLWWLLKVLSSSLANLIFMFQTLILFAVQPHFFGTPRTWIRMTLPVLAHLFTLRPYNCACCLYFTMLYLYLKTLRDFLALLQPQ